MGMIQSLFCAIMFCIERVLTWTFCAFLLMLLMFTLIVLMIYGITVGYHYAQKELASFAVASRTTTVEPVTTSTEETTANVIANTTTSKFLRLATDVTDQMELEVFGTNKPTETTDNVLLGPKDTQEPKGRPTKGPQMSQRRLEKQLISRHRRARNTTDAKYKYIYYVTEVPFLRPLRFRHGTNLTRITAS